jgi:hypothetical protein
MLKFLKDLELVDGYDEGTRVKKSRPLAVPNGGQLRHNDKDNINKRSNNHDIQK